jgi:hypothetical protein
MTTLLSSLSVAGPKGLTFSSTDPKLAAIRSEIGRLRLEGNHIREIIVKSEKHSINERKHVRFILERSTL